MSFLSKNGAGILACLLISLLAWYLGGFFPVIGAPVFAIFIGMLLHPFLSPYKQLDAGLTFSSKKLLQYAVILLGFGLNISQVFAVGQSSLPVILSTISIACCLSLPALLCTGHKTGYLDWSRFFYLWWLCYCSDSARYPCQGKGSSPSHLRYLFLQCLGCAHLSNSRNLASSIQ